jgi:hypothetical protein
MNSGVLWGIPAGSRGWGMRIGIMADVCAADRARLYAIVVDRNSPQQQA